MSTIRRIINEVKEINSYIESESLDNHRFIELKNINDDIYKLEFVFLGPKESPYEELVSVIEISIPKEYPNKAPYMRVKTKMYHPNISQSDGTICLDVLKDNWRPIYTLRTILMSIISLLSDPNPDSPLNSDAATMYKNSLKNVKDRREYLKKIISYMDH